MNNEMIKRIKANNKCLLVSSYNDEVSVGICSYKYIDNRILIECINYTNLLESLNNNNNCIIYIIIYNIVISELKNKEENKSRNE